MCRKIGLRQLLRMTQSAFDMHTNKFPLILAAFLFCLHAPLAVLALEDFAVWKAENIESADGRMMWPDRKSGCDLELAQPEGVSIGERPTIGDDEKSAVFSGEQQAAFVTRTPVKEFAGTFEVNLMLNPGDDPSGTILRFDRQWQLSVKTIGSSAFVELALWNEAGDMKFARAEVQPGIWQEVTASLKGDIATISCNGKEQTIQMTDPLRTSPAGSNIYIGLPVAAMSAANKELATPLRSSIADIRLSL